MANKAQRAFAASDRLAAEYVVRNERYLSHEYCMSRDQLTKIHDAYRQGFMAGAVFK